MRGGAQSHLMRCADNYYYVVKFQNNPFANWSWQIYSGVKSEPKLDLGLGKGGSEHGIL
jgi:hypothetical protein